MANRVIFKGDREAAPAWRVRVDDKFLRSISPLNLHRDIVNHSPDGFAWGYEGSGPAQLAFAILMYVLGDKDKVSRLYQAFKRDVIARFTENTWELTDVEVLEWVDRQRT